MSEPQQVTIYTDGACDGNPGPAGMGPSSGAATWREVTGGRRQTTSNRMELLAAIAPLEALARPCRVTLLSDSRYLVDSVMKGWAGRWRANGWKRNRTESAVNTDLWARLLDLCAAHEVEFVWVRGHAGDAENERCDGLAAATARRDDLPADDGYEKTLVAAAEQPSLFD